MAQFVGELQRTQALLVDLVDALLGADVGGEGDDQDGEVRVVSVSQRGRWRLLPVRYMVVSKLHR